jgi:hypothetical protein
MAPAKRVTGWTQRLADAPPGWKLVAWLGGVAIVCAAIQGVSRLLGAELNILGSGTGSTVLILVTLISLLLLMSRDRRPLAEHGLRVGTDWLSEARLGLLVGGAVYLSLYVVPLSLGVFQINTAALPWSWLGRTLEALVTAVPVAVAQQIIFSGYLLSLLRDACGRAGALLLTGLLFAGATLISKSSAELALPEMQWLGVNLALTAMLLAVIRWQTGNIVLPSALLAGALVVRRSIGKSHLLEPQYLHEWMSFLAPWGDPRQSPAFAGVLGCAFVAALWRWRRVGEPATAADDAALSADFKKFVPFSNLMALAPIDLWWPRLVEARFRIDPIYFVRLAWILLISTLNSLITWPERLLARRLLKHSFPAPVLIVGVHRSGTTHLHNLLALDPQFAVPKNLHVLNPCGTLVMGWLVTPFLGLFMFMRRPMDAVRVTLLSAQEEEFAIAGMTRCSPYWGFCFPRETVRHDRYIYPEEMTEAERSEWRGAMLLFLRKLTFWRRRTPLLKSPYNTARLGEMSRLLPGTRAIHICRNPYQTYLSNMHLAKEGLVAFQLQEPEAECNYSSRFLEHYRRMEDCYTRDAARLPNGQVAQVRYEDLVRDPCGEIRRLYAELNLEFSAAFEERLTAYLAAEEGYRPNKHPQLPPVVKAAIDAAMGKYLLAWGYVEQPETGRRAA